jgi:hypothetical protein
MRASTAPARHDRSSRVGRCSGARPAERAGTALFEALIVSAMLIVMFASTVFFHNVYFAKARALQAARAEAWLATDVACQGGGHGARSFDAIMPTLYTAKHGNRLPLSAAMNMTCTERNAPKTGIEGVLGWAHLGDLLGDLVEHVKDAMEGKS